LINEIVPALILLTGALLILGGTRLARGFGLPEAFGCGVALCIIAFGIGLSPAGWRDWSAGGSWGDRLLTSVRIVGLTGMLFLAGTRFNPGQLRKKSGLLFAVALSAGVLFTVIVLLLKLFGGLDSGSDVLVAATIVAGSLWLPGELSRFAREDNDLRIDWQAGAVVFTALALLAVYFYDIFAVIMHARAVGASVYIIVALYESVKLVVFFGFAYFISSRFLARAEGRISAARTTIGFVLIAVLLFALAAITTNQLGAVAWAFVAGALWRGSEIGKRFSESERPLASATLISFVFLSVLLQSHGRRLTGFLAVITAVLAAVVLKWLFAWFGMRAGGKSSRDAMRTAAAMVGPGEVGILLLGFGMTRWAIEPPVYFGILGYALLSSVFNPLVGRLASKRVTPIYQSRSEEVRTDVC
jgi:Kef-type K+ transport system membrane component KefB